jgi:hypothetical protein
MEDDLELFSWMWTIETKTKMTREKIITEGKLQRLTHELWVFLK